MKFKLILTFSLSLLLNMTLVAQEYYDGPNYGDRKRNALANINNLQDGVLLVRLSTKAKTVEALKKNGYENKAEVLLIDQREKHEHIIKAFKENYQFSEIYYFYSENSSKVKAGNWDGIILNASLEKVELNVSNKTVFVLDSEKAALADFGTDQIGFMIMDQNLEIIEDPFPSTVRKRVGTMAAERNYIDMVIKLQTQLEEFLLKTKSWKKAIAKREARQNN